MSISISSQSISSSSGGIFISNSASTPNINVTNSGTVFYQNAVTGMMYNSAQTNQTVAADTLQTMTNAICIRGGVTFTSATSRLTVPVAGKYFITAGLSWTCNVDGNAGDGVACYLYKNGVLVNSPSADDRIYGHTSAGAINGEEGNISIQYIMTLAANDYLQLYNGNWGTNSTFRDKYLSVQLIS